MINLDLIPLICDYLTDYNFYFVNKSIYEIVKHTEKDNYWKYKYDSFFLNLSNDSVIFYSTYFLKIQFFVLKNQFLIYLMCYFYVYFVVHYFYVFLIFCGDTILFYH